MKKTMLCGLIFVSALAGCQTMTPEERRAADGQTCRSYGFRPQTDAFANCLLQLELDRRATRRAAFDDGPFYGPPLVVYQPFPVRVAARPR
ncbi:hypothetical protein DUT91_06415 [Phyllobacterium salinisoli]|uniref:Lipoprotein n=1 Tax=Phyllobacterium salinisoli TaxID=1899321 RepID=A0A368K6T1_9HYPH|nr:hypothetical protein [Phyllobacterium salinisoli]RCS25059.1 hypothetical protein DUT91_06415 [Phyllobacterium salinisoli]